MIKKSSDSFSKQSTNTAKSLTGITNSNLKEADELLISGNPEPALKLASEELDKNPDDPLATFLITKAFVDLKRPGFAQVFGKHNVRQLEKHAGAWVNLGNAFQLSFDLKAAIACTTKALEIDPDGPDTFAALNNLALTYTNNGDPLMAIEYANRAAALKKDDEEVLETMGFANLQMHRWTPGWSQYNKGLGRSRDRMIRNYNNVPDWNGEAGKTVVLYGEQGLGDEVCFTQFVPKMMKDCNLIVDTCATLYTLFNSSFDCPIYKTRYVDDPPWLKDTHVDAKLSYGQGMEMYRSLNEQFTGKPYLKASREKRGWWKAILSRYPGKKTGLAWNAGLLETGKK
jgi:tetratricopeptide (TPR) repeat protein